MSYANLDMLREIADDYCSGKDVQRPLLEEALERFIVLADEKLTASVSEIERTTAALHACEGLDTVDLAKNKRGWLAEVVHSAAGVENELNHALRACCAGNTDDDEPARCQSYEASEQAQPCPRGCCVMADEKDVRAVLAAIEREDGPSAAAPLSAERALNPERYLRALLESFGPDEGVEFSRDSWAHIRANIEAALSGTPSSVAAPLACEVGNCVFTNNQCQEVGRCLRYARPHVGPINKDGSVTVEGYRFPASLVSNERRDMKVTDEMVDRFLNWPLPASVCSDPRATQQGYPNRIGTMLLTADEARQMLEHVLSGVPPTTALPKEKP